LVAHSDLHSFPTRRSSDLVAALGDPLVTGYGLVHRLQVGQGQLRIDGLDVGYRVDPVGHVDHVGVLETAHHVADGIDLADVGQELVAQALARGRAGDQAGDV